MLKNASPLLSDCSLFDLYEGKELGEGHKSWAASFLFVSAEKTLTDDEVNQEFAALKGHLEKSLDAKQR